MEAPGRQFGKELKSSRGRKSLSDREFSLHIGKTMPYHVDMRLQERGHQYQRGDDGVMSVSRLVRRMKNILEIEIGDVWVEGEVSNLRKQGNGHFYFSVKDDKAQLACAAFNAERRCSGHEALQDGARVRVLGEVTIYEARGQAQLIVKRVQPAGVGELQARFEELKKKLHTEGLFAEELKKPLPGFPRVIGLITSASGAALQDMVSVLTRRAPWVKAVLFPVAVQGSGAAPGIARAIRMMSEPENHGLPRCDVVVVGRGGGSLEDLWNFNEEEVARAIANSSIPIVSAVGHEIDFTIADFVADLRAPTPSAAAELIVPDERELRNKLQRLRDGLQRPVHAKIRSAQELIRFARRGVLAHDSQRVLREPILRADEVAATMRRLVADRISAREQRISDRRTAWKARHPRLVVERRVEGLRQFRLRYSQQARHCLQSAFQRMERLRQLVRTLGPESAFERGFSITMSKSGTLVTDPEQVENGDQLVTRVAGGTIESEVLK
ncbi:MAG: exodeoxyribonuclease VII large subunit [Roseibacillus sp. TMED18]|nr:MAG: exodeoxyribonuclease VII large subunit [Roseibacillus sp. TMED18]